MPKVAVITPTYNRGDNGLLRKTMRSVLAQSYIDFVYLVIDDGSTDSTPAVVDEFARHDHRVHYFRMERAPGRKVSASFAQNSGIRTVLHSPEFADTKYVTFIHSDDLMAQGSIENRATVLDRDERVKLVYGYMGICNETMQPFEILKGPVTTNPKEIAKLLKKRRSTGFPHHTVMPRIDLLRATGEYDENIGYAEDRDFSIRLLETLEPYEIYCIPEAIQFYRAHDASVTGLYKEHNLTGVDCAYIDRKHGKTACDRVIDVTQRVITRPHSLLPEAIKKPLRIVRNEVIQGKSGKLDPFVAQIECRQE